MDLSYFKRLKELETEFGSSQRKAFATATIDEEAFYISLNIFSNFENIERQDKDFEITQEIMPQNRLGTALVEICSNFNKIEQIINKYVEICEKAKIEDSKMFIDVKVITPLFLELSEENKYFNILKNFETNEYKKEVELFIKRKKKILDFDEGIFSNMTSDITNTEIQDVYKDIIDTNNILKDYISTQTIKSFTIDYLKTYILEIREIIKLIDIYCNDIDDNIYKNLNNKEKLFLFSTIENPINNFIYPLSKVEPKIKIDNKYINVWDFKGKYLYKKLQKNKNKEEHKKILLDYIRDNDIELFNTYRITTIRELLIISFIEIMKNKLTIRKCENCKNYFITENRTDEVYCNRISPQNNKKTCKEYGAKKKYRDEIKSRPLKNEHNKTMQFYRMRINRAKNEIEKEILIKKFEKYKRDYQRKKNKYNNEKGKLKEIDFIEWIVNQKNLNKKGGE